MPLVYYPASAACERGKMFGVCMLALDAASLDGQTWMLSGLLTFNSAG